MFGFPSLLIPDGSTIGGKVDGTIRISDVSDINFPVTYDIINTILPTKYMYANGIWKTVNAGGSQDILTCRVEMNGGRHPAFSFNGRGTAELSHL